MNICLFTEDEISKPLPLCDERAQHIIKVLHKKSGDTFTAGIIGGQSGTAVIREITDECINFEFSAGGDGNQRLRYERDQGNLWQFWIYFY